MKNNNGAAVKKLSSRSLRHNRTRNLFAVLAIILTGMLFTAVFSLLGGVMQVTEESTMREVGGRAHAGLKGATMEQYEKIISDPLVKRSDYNILIGVAENILKRSGEVRYLPEEKSLEDYFITLEEGHLPDTEDGIVVDTFVMDECKIPHALGEKITLVIPFMGEKVEKEFTVSGWYEGDSISHASELFVSEAFWMELKGDLTDADFKAWGEEHPEDVNVGLLAANLYFDNSSHIEEKVRTVIEHAGYEPEKDVDYGVNWAYMENRLEQVDPFTIVMAAGAVCVILLTGYLIIYNIFQISVMGDIRFYGLLKTIGTTKKQLRRLIMRQAMVLSLIGIPLGLLLGYGIGKVLLPFMMSFMDYGNAAVSLEFHPLIFVFGAAFSILTVFLSCRKPGKVAGSVSPVEAVKYTEGAPGSSRILRKRAKSREKSGITKKKSGDKKTHSFSVQRMAFANLGRNKRKTGVVVTAISLSMILLTLVMTGVGSFRIDKFLEQRIVGDIMIGSVNLFSSSSRDSDYELDPGLVSLADEQEGILETNEMWVGFGTSVKLDETGKERFKKLYEEEKLEHSEYDDYRYQQVMEQDGILDGYVYGYTDSLLENVKVLEGKLDIEKFQNGDYVLLTTIRASEELDAADSIYHPGDKLTMSSITETSNIYEEKNENGEILNVRYDNLAEKEYEVMAIIDLPYSMDIHRYAHNTMDAVLPLKELSHGEGVNNICFTKSYKVEPDSLEDVESAVKDYTEKECLYMGYASKNSLKKEFSGMTNVIGTIGISLAGVIAFIGILNFINAVFTGILARKYEFAMLQSIGMTKAQLQKMLIWEGISYVGIAGAASLCIGSIFSRAILQALNKVIMFFEYRFQILPFVVMVPILAAAAILTPLLSFRQLQKHSIVERLREGE
ncbi:MAG: FtsX-like permease family protein [Candidatus Choladocola sp.]|nr:FtsX-like permease family protein [Candidatus Choladocola sp.]